MNAKPLIFWTFLKKIVKFDELLPKININLQCQWPEAFRTSALISFPLRETGSRCYCSSILLSTKSIVFVQLRRVRFCTCAQISRTGSKFTRLYTLWAICFSRIRERTTWMYIVSSRGAFPLAIVLKDLKTDGHTKKLWKFLCLALAKQGVLAPWEVANHCIRVYDLWRVGGEIEVTHNERIT